MPALDDLSSCIHAVHQQTGISVVEIERFGHGESGAHRVYDCQGNVFVLKTHPDPRHVAQYEHVTAITDSLRATECPVPRHLAEGTCDAGAWQIVEWVSGESHRPLTGQTVGHMLNIIEMHRGRALEDNPDWLDEVIESVLVGCDGYCQVESLRDCSSRTRQVLDTIQRWTERSRGTNVNTADVVHFDFHPGNIIIEDGSVNAIIDWSGVTAGDATFDLVTLLFYCWDERPHSDQLITTVRKRASADAIRLYMAHIILRQVDWSIRHHDEETVTGYLALAERIADHLSALD